MDENGDGIVIYDKKKLGFADPEERMEQMGCLEVKENGTLRGERRERMGVEDEGGGGDLRGTRTEKA